MGSSFEGEPVHSACEAIELLGDSRGISTTWDHSDGLQKTVNNLKGLLG